MKTTNLIKIAVAVLLGIVIEGLAYANNDKFSRVSAPAVRESTRMVMLSEKEIQNQPLEDWMFEPEYLSEEAIGAVESWMFYANYLSK